MAGAGYKLFNTGDVLTAAQVNTYLQEQTVMVFANSTARTTALSGVLAEGMVSYLQDTNAVEVYNGSAWVGVSGAGDVTEVQAGTGISVASGTGPIPVVTNTMATAVDAKGDLIVGTGADTFARLAVGTNGYTLVADSSVSPTGLKWAAPAGGGKLLQIVDSSFATEVNVTSTSYADLGLSATITPASASNKVLVLGVLNAGKEGADSQNGALAKLVRGATDINQVLSWAFYTNANSKSLSNMPAFMYLDDPNTTSATTYKIQVASSVSGSTSTFNWTGGGTVARSRIFLLEIGA